MDIDNIEKKLREARFFLGKMREEEGQAFGDKGPFDHCLSAFLNAAMTARNGFRAEQDRARNEAIKAWRASWEQALSPEERALYDFMREDRVAEVHGSGSRRSAKFQEVPVHSSYSDRSGTLHVFGPPAVLGFPGPRAIIQRPAYTFTIAGTERRVTEACANYLALLERMLVKFKADRPA